MTSHPTWKERRAKVAAKRPRLLITGLMVLLVAVFTALGTWQMKRLCWKLELIARVDARIRAQPVPAPVLSEWSSVSAEKDEYRRVSARGTFQHERVVLAQAVTERGAGFWVLTPLLRGDHSIILINRGFIPSDRRNVVMQLMGPIPHSVRVTGLLRMTEPRGAFLRTNDPAAGRWYSRDVAAIAAAKGLKSVAPFFIDADRTLNPKGLPIGGLTVVNFRNDHLAYGLTWYALAVMAVLGARIVYRRRAA